MKGKKEKLVSTMEKHLNKNWWELRNKTPQEKNLDFQLWKKPCVIPLQLEKMYYLLLIFPDNALPYVLSRQRIHFFILITRKSDILYVHIRNKLDEVRKKVQALKDKYDRSLSSKEALQKESDDLEVYATFIYSIYIQARFTCFYFNK